MHAHMSAEMVETLVRLGAATAAVQPLATRTVVGGAGGRGGAVAGRDGGLLGVGLGTLVRWLRRIAEGAVVA